MFPQDAGKNNEPELSSERKMLLLQEHGVRVEIGSEQRDGDGESAGSRLIMPAELQHTHGVF